MRKHPDMHRSMVEFYSSPHNAFFIREKVSKVIIETEFKEMSEVKSYSNKAPDLLYLLKNHKEKVYVAEIKSTNHLKALQDARQQIESYYIILRNSYTEVIPVIIVGSDVFINGEIWNAKI